MSEIKVYEIRKGTRLAIELTNGSRMAGTATKMAKETPHMTNEITIKDLNGHLQTIDTEQVASLLSLG